MALEQRIQTLTCPQEEKNGLSYKLREAFAKQSGELIVKAVIEIATQFVKSHGL